MRRGGMGMVLVGTLAGGACQNDVEPGPGGFETRGSSDATSSGSSISASSSGEGSVDGSTTQLPGSSSSEEAGSTAGSESRGSSTSTETDVETTADDGAAGRCGDGVIQVGEQCDGSELGPLGSCEALGLGSGTVTCDPVVCMLDTQLCSDEGGATTGI